MQVEDTSQHFQEANDRPRMLNELFVEAMLFMDRDSLDSMQLACRFMFDYIREHEANKLALRQISRVSLGDIRRVGSDGADEEYDWLSVMRVIRRSGDQDQELVFTCVHRLLPYLRTAYCEYVRVTLSTIQSAGAKSYLIACGILFDDLVARETTHVGRLSVDSEQGSVELLNRSIDAFKSVRKLEMIATSDELIEPEAFNEVFFASLAQRRIAYFDSGLDISVDSFLEIDAATAFAYLFAEPLNGVSRELSGVQCTEKDLLKLIRKKAGELDSRQRVDLEATIGLYNPDRVDPAGFEKYEEGEGKWVVNDLDNGMKLEIEEDTHENRVVIRVYSPM
ncbi:hypothetical protein AAVH_23563 [Aphelenchoides avenae]|nr:hypothetical protein AAVH_23563 [Aphelenchus avenae]